MAGNYKTYQVGHFTVTRGFGLLSMQLNGAPFISVGTLPKVPLDP